MDKINKLQTIICNNTFLDSNNNEYKFKCFQDSKNLMINGKLIGDFSIFEKSETLFINFTGGHYEVLDLMNGSLKLKQDNMIFVINKIK